MMTAKEELIQAIERSPDEVVESLLQILKVLQRQSVLKASALTQVEQSKLEEVPSRLRRKGGVLVIKTGALDEFNANTFIREMREERIHE
jgi:hypothetical protein